MWPTSFELEYVLSLPYVLTVQAEGLSIPMHVWVDGSRSAIRMDAYDGMDTTYMLPGFIYNTFPRINTLTCWWVNSTAGPTADGGLAHEDKVVVLPDISSWLYAGRSHVKGTPAHAWMLQDNQMEKTSTYTFYTGVSDGRPLSLVMAGVNLLSGSHFDEYLVDITSWQPGPLRDAADVFSPPEICSTDYSDYGEQSRGLRASGSAAAAAAVAALLPGSLLAGAGSSTRAGAVVSAALGLAGRRAAPGTAAAASSSAASGAAAAADAAATVSNARTAGHAAAATAPATRAFADAWNSAHAASAGFRLAANHMSHLSDAHFAATRLGGSGADSDLPVNVDWRGTGADTSVKDQASCGSCWAFATTGTMQGTWFVATGEVLSLSEQHIVDCAWDHEVNGCFGGWGDGAMDLIIESGGAAAEDDYPYLGQNGFCHGKTSEKVAMFSGYHDITPYDEKAIMEAVATHGPLYVGLDAVHPTFKYYSEGVYHRADCGTTLETQNHAVTLVGYGTTDGGVDYWLIRNSWSKLWGEDGYVKISRKGNDCGISASAMFTKPDAAAVGAARARLAARAASAQKTSGRARQLLGGLAGPRVCELMEESNPFEGPEGEAARCAVTALKLLKACHCFRHVSGCMLEGVVLWQQQQLQLQQQQQLQKQGEHTLSGSQTGAIALALLTLVLFQFRCEGVPESQRIWEMEDAAFRQQPSARTPGFVDQGDFIACRNQATRIGRELVELVEEVQAALQASSPLPPLQLLMWERRLESILTNSPEINIAFHDVFGDQAAFDALVEEQEGQRGLAGRQDDDRVPSPSDEKFSSGSDGGSDAEEAKSYIIPLSRSHQMPGQKANPQLQDGGRRPTMIRVPILGGDYCYSDAEEAEDVMSQEREGQRGPGDSNAEEDTGVELSGWNNGDSNAEEAEDVMGQEQEGQQGQDGDLQRLVALLPWPARAHTK
ncbi:hypothetical protein FOA52_015386 [Chlamydomonas sp. UWO 241]|nr:hypothetical protein FOA52_015386 [Chlamydomonas sp. UWO 241]